MKDVGEVASPDYLRSVLRQLFNSTSECYFHPSTDSCFSLAHTFLFLIHYI